MSNGLAVHDNPNHMFIPRHELTKLRELLDEIPALALELGITVTKQARLGSVGRGSKPSRPSEQPLPYNVGASDAAEHLHNTLVGWVRHILEYRGLRYDDTITTPARWLPTEWVPGEFVGPLQPGRPAVTTAPVSTAGLARWLDRHLIALAMTEGSETALEEIGAAVDRASWIVCPPVTPIVVDETRVKQARRLMLNARGIATLARELGEEYRHLTKRRIFVLRDKDLVRPVPGPWRPDWPMLFRVGEVMDAHLVLPIRERHAEAS